MQLASTWADHQQRVGRQLPQRPGHGDGDGVRVVLPPVPELRCALDTANTNAEAGLDSAS
jgi:hypothetical protein